MRRITRRGRKAITVVEVILTREFAGVKLQQTYLEGIQAVSRLETEFSATPILVAKAQGLIAIGRLSRELGLPGSHSAAHHLKALEVARHLGNKEIALEAALGAAHCYESVHPSKVTSYLRMADHIIGDERDPWRKVRHLVRLGQFFDVVRDHESKTQLYRQEILPRVFNAQLVNIDHRALALVAYSQHMILTSHLDEAWQVLQDPSIAITAHRRRTVAYEIVCQLGHIYVQSGDVGLAQLQYQSAEQMRLLDRLPPHLTRNLYAAIEGRPYQ